MSSSADSTNYYSILEVPQTATRQDITASYRRLALIHHPDKNPNNLEAATAAFQKIQDAYETLNDPIRRGQYDMRTRMPFPFFVPPRRDYGGPEYWADQSEYEFDFGSGVYSSSEDSEEEEEFQDPREGVFGNGPEPTFRPSRAGGFWAGRWDGLDITAEEIKRRLEQIRQAELAQLFAERQAKSHEEAQRKKEKDELKKAQEDVEKAAKKELQVLEEKEQKLRWLMLDAHTDDEKLKTCLHSGFCTKTQLPKKFKCGACNVKRGTVAFECPYCATVICQQCVALFAKKRLNPEKYTAPKSEPVPKPTSTPEPMSDPELASEHEPTPKPEPKPKPKTAKKPNQEPKQGSEPESATESKPQPQPKNGAHHKNPGKKPNPNPNGSKAGGPAKKPTCYNCNKVGHIAKNCRLRKPESRTCYSCGQQGHIVNNCPNQ